MTDQTAEQVAEKIVADWNREHPNEPPFKYWAGGDEAPEDWDGDVYLCRDGKTYHLCGYGWQHGYGCVNSTTDWDRIGYRPLAVRKVLIEREAQC